MKHTNRILTLLGVSLHVLVAVLLAVGLVGANQAGELDGITLGLAVALAAVYLAGTVWFNRGKPIPANGEQAWLGIVILVWAQLAVRSSAFVWLEFPLVMLACFLLATPFGLLISALLLAGTLFTTVPESGWGGFIGPTIGTALAVFIVYAYKALRDETEHYKVLEHAAGVAEERARLSREVHDTMAQGLSSIVLLGRALDKQLGDNEAARATLNTIRATAADNLAEARRFVSDNASDANRTEAPLPQRLKELAQAAEQRQRALGRELQVTVNADGAYAVPAAAAAVIERVAREGISNIERHSSANRAVVTADMLGGTATVDVYDNGPGIGENEGYGLKGLRARVEEAGGELTIDGSVLAASVPVEGK